MQMLVLIARRDLFWKKISAQSLLTNRQTLSKKSTCSVSERATTAMKFLKTYWGLCRGVQRSGHPRAKYLMLCLPTTFWYWGMLNIQALQNYLPRPLPRAKDYAKNFTSSEKEKKAEQVSYHVAQLQQGIKRTCKGTEFCVALLERKKWSSLRKERWRSSKKLRFQRIVHSAESVLTAPNNVLKICSLFFIFFPTIEREESFVTHDIDLWQNLPLKMKPSTQETIVILKRTLL